MGHIASHLAYGDIVLSINTTATIIKIDVNLYLDCVSFPTIFLYLSILRFKKENK